MRSTTAIPLEAFKLFLIFLYSDKLHFADEEFRFTDVYISWKTVGVIAGAKRTTEDVEEATFESGWALLIGLLRAAELYMVPSLQTLVEKELVKRYLGLKADYLFEQLLPSLLSEISSLLTEDTRAQLEAMLPPSKSKENT